MKICTIICYMFVFLANVIGITAAERARGVVIGITAKEKNEAINNFMSLVECDNEDRALILENLWKIISTKCGYELITRINNVFYKKDQMKCVGNAQLCVFIKKENTYLFDAKRLRDEINEKEEKVIYDRNMMIRVGKINIKTGEDGEFSYKDGKATIVFRKEKIELNVFKKINFSIKKDSSTVDISLFHELLHLYHFIYDPITANEMRANIKVHMRGKNRFGMPKSKFTIKEVDSWEDYFGNWVIPYIKEYDSLVTQRRETDIELTLNCEELFTIRGKKRSMYDISENSYRLFISRPLRYGHIFSFVIDGNDENLYNEYYTIARR